MSNIAALKLESVCRMRYASRPSVTTTGVHPAFVTIEVISRLMIGSSSATNTREHFVVTVNDTSLPLSLRGKRREPFRQEDFDPLKLDTHLLGHMAGPCQFILAAHSLEFAKVLHHGDHAAIGAGTGAVVGD